MIKLLVVKSRGTKGDQALSDPICSTVTRLVAVAKNGVYWRNALPPPPPPPPSLSLSPPPPPPLPLTHPLTHPYGNVAITEKINVFDVYKKTEKKMIN